MSKTLNKLAPHIKEITWALNDEITSHEIGIDLDTLVNTYGISLPAAKQAVIRKYGGDPRLLKPRRICRVNELQNALPSVDIEGRILNLSQRVYERDGEKRIMFSGIMADKTGTIEFTTWGDFGVEEGKTFRFINSYTKTWKGRIHLYVGRKGAVEAIEDARLPSREELQKDIFFTIDQIQLSKGVPEVNVEGNIIEVRNGTGLIFRCPECHRTVLKSECLNHGRVGGVADLRIMGILDDGYGAINFIAGCEITEAIIGLNIEDCVRIARDRIDVGSVKDIIEKKIIGMYVSASGDVTADGLGAVLHMQSLVAQKRDTRMEAIELLEEMGKNLS